MNKVGHAVLGLTLLIPGLGASSLAATYHVAPPPEGNDAHGGGAGDPWATLQYAAGQVTAGDTVLVHAGDYVGFNLTTSGGPGQPITFRAADGETVRIVADNPSTSDGINIEGADWIVIEGFQVNSRTRAGIRAVLCSHVTIRNSSCDANGKWGIFTGFCDDLLIEGNRTSNSVVEHGIYVSNSGDRPVIRRNLIWGNNANGIHMNGDLSQGGDGIISEAIVEANRIWDNGTAGGSAINMDGVQSSMIRNNLIWNTHASGISLYRIDGGGPSTGNRVLNNTVLVAADGRWALNIQNGSSGNTVRNNVLWNDHSFRGSLDICASCLSGFTSDHNAVMDRFTADGGNSIWDLATWRTETGNDAASFVSTPEALFRDPSVDDYRLEDDGPAVDAGESRPIDVPTDLEGRSRPVGAGWDIGALEATALVFDDGFESGDTSAWSSIAGQ